MGRPHTFFPVESKILQGRGQNILFAKKSPKDTIFLEKSKNILFYPARGGRGEYKCYVNCDHLQATGIYLLRGY